MLEFPKQQERIMLAESLYVLGCDVMLEKINIDILQAAVRGVY